MTKSSDDSCALKF